MSPIEQVWSKIRKLGFINHFFPTIDSIGDNFFGSVQNLTNNMIKSIVHRDFLEVSF